MYLGPEKLPIHKKSKQIGEEDTFLVDIITNTFMP